MTAQVTNKACGSPQTPVSLSFNHHTSAIKVKYTNDGASAVTITGISITGVKYSGTLNNGTWTLGSAVNSSTSNPFSLSLSTNVAAGATVDLTGTSNIFLMLPQTLPSGAKLIVTTSDNSYECPLSGSWVAGKSYTYHISVEDAYEYHLYVGRPNDFTYEGGEHAWMIESYKEKADGTQEPVAWTAQFSTDGGNTWTSSNPSWVSLSVMSGAGNIGQYLPRAYVSAQTSSSSTQSADNVLKAATAVSNYDLSLHDIQGNTTTRNTANCYMVHAPGTYKLPLVYGNAIKNGSTNSSAYNPSGTSGTNFLKPFVNHFDESIIDPWLKNNRETPDGASLIWQDVNGLISAVGIDGDYLTFEITTAAIAEGNAVIAATKSGTVVWSWHIWVTPEKFSNLTTVATGSHTYTVTPVNLGWVATGNVTTTGYAGREVMVKISQSESDGLNRTFTIRQLENIVTVTPSKGGYNTYYQWGRKDPEIPAANMTSTTDHAAYNISGSSVSKVYSGSSVTIGTTIQNPLTHYYNSSNAGPYSTAQYNLWDATKASKGVGTNATVKTIYDPCPPGFCVPTANLYSYFSSNSGSATWDGTSGQAGRTWTKDTPNLFFPASGYRSLGSAVLGGVGSRGRCWSASPNSPDYGYSLNFSSSSWDNSSNSRANGYPVRAVAEE